MDQNLTVKQKRAQMTPEQRKASDQKWEAFKEQFRAKVRDEYHLPHWRTQR